MSRPLGGYIGHRPVPAAAGLNSVARGIWTLREAQRLKQAGTWPTNSAVPQTISGLALWLDAADPAVLFDATSGGSLVAATGEVKRWEDKSGNSRHVSEATNPPTRQTAVRNGFDVIRFDGTNDILRTTGNFPLTGNPAFSVFVVYQKTNNAKGNVLGWGDTGGFATAVGFYDDGAGAAVPFASSNNFNVTPATNNAFNQLSILKSAGPISSTTNVRRNGVSIATSNHSANTPDIDSQPFTIGRWANYDLNGALNGTLQGDIAEIIIYDTALSDTNRGIVESYLMSKWAIT